MITAIGDVSHFLNNTAIGEDVPLQKRKRNAVHTVFSNVFMMNEKIVRYGCVRASLRELSSRRKSKTRLGGTGSQKEVAALRTMPGGLPGSSTLFLVMTRTSSAPLPESVVHWCAAEAVTPPQKLITILSASFSMLFLPSVLVITAANDFSHKDLNFLGGIQLDK